MLLLQLKWITSPTLQNGFSISNQWSLNFPSMSATVGVFRDKKKNASKRQINLKYKKNQYFTNVFVTKV